MKRVLLFTVTLALALNTPAADRLENGFAHPPESTKPWCYWYWISDNISREGITKDLDAMHRAGISQAFIGNIYLDDVKHGTVKALTDEWWGMVEHAIREGGRLGVDIGMFNCPGWSQSGGPWIRPDQAMRYVATSERRVHGPSRFEEKLPAPTEPFQDVAALAFPAPRLDSDGIAAHSPHVTCSPGVEHAERLVDADRKTVARFPAKAGKEPLTIDIDVAEGYTARSLVLVPASADFAAQCELQAANADGSFAKVRSFPVDRSNNGVNVGFLPHAPVAISFPAVTSRRFRLVFTGVSGQAGLAEIELSGAARLERFIEKQLGKMHPTPLPMWNAYLWPETAEPDAADLAIAPATVVDLSRNLSADGTLRWDVPAGDWIVLRTGMTPTGTKNSPASPEGQGLEVDKMNRAAAQAHFEAYMGKLLSRMPKGDRKALKHVVADSYEMGSQNWTDGFEGLFRKTYGYDPHPWLPVLTGRIVGTADQSDRFLWDVRRLVADHVALDYVGGLREACHSHGLKLWLENYGHWGFPGEFLQYGGQSDEVSGEFWATGDLGSIELRCASSAAHIYGKPVVHAEAFTSGVLFQSTPWSLKKRGDWALTEGINHWVLHVYIHQPSDEQRPGVNAWFSTEFNRHNTWFEQSREWIDYYRRCDFLLQQGRHVADVAYFIGEDVPKMTGVRNPPLPTGYDFDYINAEVIERRLDVKNGRFVLPDGMSYRILVLPELATMRPELLRKLRDLVAAGGIILGPPPSRSPSLKEFPTCDQEVRRLADEIWQGLRPPREGVAKTDYRKGRVFLSADLKPVLDQLQIPPDFSGVDPKRILWTHRSTESGEIYFISNQGEQSTTISPVFRVQGKAPELWDAVTGQIVKTAIYEPVSGGTRVPIELGPRGSILVVFRENADKARPVAEVRCGDRVLMTTSAKAMQTGSAPDSKGAVNTFTLAGWVKPEIEVALPPEADSGVVIHLARNDIIEAAHGQAAFGDAHHAGAGISVGRNGICVFEHSANYFAPLLVHPASLTEWTHVAVVYQSGRPSLYLNGRLVRQGLQSAYTVHSSLTHGENGSSFKGESGGFSEYSRALAAAEIAALSATKPSGNGIGPLPKVTLARGGKGVFTAEVTQAGSYTVKWLNGRTKAFSVESLPAPTELTGSWQVRFPGRMDVPEQVRLERLIPLNEHPDEAVKTFSGSVAYGRDFDVSSDCLATGRRLILDLGRVEALAEVLVNGRTVGVLWQPPFALDITEAVKPGRNTLEVRVTGTWRNRLIGQAKFPNGYPGKDSGGRMAFAPYLAADLKVRPNEPLSPFGLIGPVRLQSRQRVQVEAGQ